MRCRRDRDCIGIAHLEGFVMPREACIRFVRMMVASTFLAAAVVGCARQAEPAEDAPPASSDAPPASSGIITCASDNYQDCFPGGLAGNALYNIAMHADYVVLADLQMAFDSPSPIITDSGVAETSDFTPLVIQEVKKVYRNRVGDPSAVFFPGTCSPTGECTQQPGSFPVRLKPGLNLLLASRYCGDAGLTKTILVAQAAFPVEGDTIFDAFGTPSQWTDLEDQIEPLSGVVESPATCPAN